MTSRTSGRVNGSSMAGYLADALRGIPGMVVRRRGCRITVTPADAVPPEHRALSSGRLASDHERMARDGREARKFGSDRALRRKVTAARAAGKLGVR